MSNHISFKQSPLVINPFPLPPPDSSSLFPKHCLLPGITSLHCYPVLKPSIKCFCTIHSQHLSNLIHFDFCNRKTILRRKKKKMKIRKILFFSKYEIHNLKISHINQLNFQNFANSVQNFYIRCMQLNHAQK